MTCNSRIDTGPSIGLRPGKGREAEASTTSFRSFPPAAAACTLTAVAVVLAGCAGLGERTEETADERSASISTDCFTISLARDFRYLDETNLIVYAPGRQGYHLELSGACMGLRGDFRIGLRARTDRMCGFAGDAVITEGAFPERCPVLDVRRLDEDQLQALIAQFEPGPDAQGEFEVVIPEAED